MEPNSTTAMDSPDPLDALIPPPQLGHSSFQPSLVPGAAVIEWPDWDEALYDPKFTGNPLMAFYAGIEYANRALITDHSAYTVCHMTEACLRWLHFWNVKTPPKVMQKTIKGDQSVLVAFQKGAVWLIDTLRKEAPIEIKGKGGLGLLLDELERDVHRQFLGRVAVCAGVNEAKNAEMTAMASVKNPDEESEDNADGEEEGKGRHRIRAKSKKAKKMKKVAKQEKKGPSAEE